ncbi:MAG TPA: pseudouridine synthase, partial [Candidatus Saccharimonadales bacterium]|nr:pseudouridine synthase [Candidatus Saccharimonadales bacterium]
MPTQPSDPLRLNKHLALYLGISRREADNLIDQQKVQINDQTASLGARFVLSDKITVDGKELNKKVEYQYLALNKPVGYVCSRKKQGDSPTIYDLLPGKYHTLKPVGRLDRNSSGIVLLTNNGDFAYRMTHPSFRKTKIYNVRLEKNLEPLHQQMISDFGVTLDDGPSKFQLERMNETDRKSWIVTMHEGRNRQIRRTFGSLGYTVSKLHRTNFGNYALGDIKTG